MKGKQRLTYPTVNLNVFMSPKLLSLNMVVAKKAKMLIPENCLSKDLSAYNLLIIKIEGEGLIQGSAIIHTVQPLQSKHPQLLSSYAESRIADQISQRNPNDGLRLPSLV